MRLRAGLAALLLAAACAPAPPDEAGSPAEPLALPDLAGRTVSLSEYAGQVVLVDFWATWCAPCVEEVPMLVEVHEAYRDRGFTVLGVAVEEFSPADVRSFLDEQKVSYPVLFAQEKPAGWRVRALPTAYLVDRKGFVRRRYLGTKDPLAVRRDVQGLLDEKAPAAPPRPEAAG